MTASYPIHHFGGEGPLLHFAHPNAYPPACFHRFADGLTSQFTVFGLPCRALWDNTRPNPYRVWTDAANDLIDAMDYHGMKNVVGTGLSLGAVSTLFAAIKRPDLFSKLVLIDPVFLPPSWVRMSSITPYYFRKQRKMVQRAFNRKHRWPDREAVFEHYRPKSVFKRFPDETLWDYINGGTRETADGDVELIFPREWEGMFYASPPRVWGQMHRLKHDVTFVRAERSDVFFAETFAKVKAILPNASYVEMKGVGHMIPLEQPQELAEIVVQSIR